MSDLLDGRGEENVLCTTSRLKAWWLSLFKGYSIKCVRREPRQASFGSLSYKSVWVLEEPSSARPGPPRES